MRGKGERVTSDEVLTIAESYRQRCAELGTIYVIVAFANGEKGSLTVEKRKDIRHRLRKTPAGFATPAGLADLEREKVRDNFAVCVGCEADAFSHQCGFK